MAVKKIKKCQICQTSFEGRRDAKTCSAACRKRLQRAISRNQSPPKKKTGVESAIAREIHRISSGLLKKHVLCMPLAISDERGSIPVVPVPVENKNLVPRPDVRPVGAIYKPEPQTQVSTEVSLAQSGAQVVDTVTRLPEEGAENSLSTEAARTVSDTYKTTTVRNIWGDTVSKFKRRQVILVALVFLFLFPLGGLLLMNLHGNGGTGDGGNGSGGPFSSAGGISGTDLNKRDKFSVNLTLEAKNTLIVTPTPKPKNLEKGQIYLDQSSDKLLFYDGEKLHDLGATSNVVNNIQGPTNITNSTIINSTIQSGVSKLAGTANQINVSSGTGNVTLSLPQDIGTGSSPTFAGLNLGSALQVASGGTGVSSFTTNSLLLGNGSGAIQTTNVGSTGDCLIVNGSGVPTFQSCAGGGGVFAGSSQTPGNLTKFDTTTNQIVDSLVSESGSLVTVGGDLNASGIISGDGSGITALDAGNISSGVLSDSRLSGNVTLQGNAFNGASQLVQLTGGGLLPVLDGSNLTNVDALTLQGNGASFFTDASNISSGTLNDLRLSANVALLGNDNNFTGANLQHNGNDICDNSNNCNYASSSGSGNYIQNGTSAQTADFNITGDGTAGGTLTADTVNAITSFELNGTDINTGGTLSNVAYLNQNQTLTGHNIFKNSSDSTTAFQIQDVGGTSNLFIADTVNNRIGIGTLGPGYSLDVQSGDINTTGLYRVNGSQISSANLSNDTNLAKINGANVFTANNTFSGTLAIQGANSLTLGTASNLGSIIFRDGTSANTATLQVAGALSGDVTFGLPVTTGTQTICTVEAGNCAGSGSGVTTSGGTPGRLAVFTGSQALGDSSIADDGSTVTVTVGQVIQGSAGLTIGDTGVNGQLVFKNGSNSNTLTLQSGVTTGNLTFTLPTGDGSNGDCLQTNGSGVLAFSACTGGAGGGVTSVNTLTGVLNLVGTANQVDVSSAGDTITLSLPQDINTSGNANFRTITLTGQAAGDNLIVGNAVSGATGTLLDLKVNNVSKLTVDASGNVNTTGQYQVNGSQISSADLSNDSNLAKLDGTGPQVFTGDNEFTGTILTQLDSATAFQIQNGAGTSNLFVADTTTSRIGIGTATPGYMLDVNGDINTSGVYRINGVTVCSASGCTAASGSGNYIQNGTSLQAGANFNIDGTGKAATLNATSAIQLNGTSINVGGTLSNVAYLDQANSFSQSQTITAGGGKTTLALTSTGSNTGITIGGDTNLYRENAGVLSTDNALNVYDGAYVQGGSNGTLTLYNGNESITQTDFTQALNKSAINIVTDFTDGAYTPGIVWSTQDNNSTKPKAGIYLKEDGSAGTSLLFGTSDTYSTGLTNDALTLGPKGDAIFKNGSNSSTGFQVQNATGTGLFTINTSTGATLTSTLFIDTLGSGGTTAVCWNGSSQISTCASTGSIGFWNRTGTTLSPATAGDAITTSGNISTSGSGAITAAGTLTANGQSVVIQPSSSLTAGQTNISQTLTNASSSGGTVNGYNQSITVSNSGSGSTTNGLNISLADNAAGSPGNIDRGINISLSGSNSSRAEIGLLSTVTRGIALQAISSGFLGNGSVTCNGVNVGLGLCAGDSAGSNGGAGIYGYSGSRATSNIYDVEGSGVYGITQGSGVAGAFYGGIKGIANQSANNAYTSMGVYGKGKGGTSATVYGGYFTLDSGSTATAGAALFASNSSTTANILQLQDNTTDVFTVADGGNVTAAGDIQIQGGDLTTNQTTFNLLNTTATTLNIGGAATTALNLGPTGATATSVNLAGGSGATGCTVDGATGNLTCSGNIISGSNQAFLQNGNSMGATAVLGTNDSNSLAFETNNVTKWLINTTGDFLPNLNDTYNIGSDTARVANLYLGGETLHIGSSTSDESTISYNNTSDSLILKNATNSTTALQVQDKDSNVLLTADTTTNKRINVTGDVNVGSRYGNRLFSDNFESGPGFQLWDQGNFGSISTDTATVHAGKYSAKINPSGTFGYADASIASSSTAYIRAWVNITSQTSANADLLTLCDNGSNCFTVFRNGSSAHIWNNVTGTDVGSGGSFTTSAWHLIEMRITTGAGTGTTQLWFDGTQVVNLSSQNNGANPMSVIELGASNNRTFTAYVDDLAVDTVTTGTASSLNVDDSFHVGGSGTFGGSVLIQSTTSAPALNVQAATGGGSTVRVNADDNNLATLQLYETNDRGFNLFYDGNPNQFVIQANDAGTLSDVVTIQRTDGSVLFQNSADSTTAFQVQDQNDNPILYVDTTNAAVRIKGTGANGGGGRLQFGDGDLTGSQNAWVGEHGTGDSDQLQLQGANGVYITGQYDGSVEIANFFSDTSGIYGTGVNALAVAQFNSRAVFGYDGSTQDAIIQGNSGKGFRLYTDGNDSTTRSTFSVDTDGAALFQNYNDTTAAFQIQDSAAASLFTVNSSNKIITVGGTSLAAPSGGGTVGSWNTTTSLTTAVYGATSVAYNGYIYNFGGYNGSSAITTVYYAPLNGDGSVGSWTSTTALPNARYNATSVVYNGYVYVIGGTNGTSDQTTVYYAKLNSNGTVGSWSSATALSSGLQLPTSAVNNNYLYVLGGSNSGTAQTAVYYAKFNTDGTIGSWTSTTALPAVRVGASTIVNNGYIYELGGGTSLTCTPAGTDTVYYASLNSDGTIGSWTTDTSTLADYRYGAAAVAWGGYAYILGGLRSGGGCLPATLYHYASLNSNGSTDSGAGWPFNSTPYSTFQNTAVVYNGYAYMLGGTSDGSTTLSTVMYASLSGSQRTTNDNTQLVVNGSVTSGDNNIKGGLQVQGQATFTQGVSVGSNLSVGGPALFKNTSNSTTAFQIQNATGAATIFTADTTNSIITVAGTTTTFANLTLTNAHFKSTQTTKPTIGTPASCGTSPSSSVTNNSTDSAGSITITTGSGSVAGACSTVVTFNKAYGAAPKSVQLTDSFGNTVGSYIGGISNTTFTVNLKGYGAAIPVSTSFTIYYWIIE